MKHKCLLTEFQNNTERSYFKRHQLPTSQLPTGQDGAFGWEGTKVLNGLRNISRKRKNSYLVVGI